jgi:hypothetical protein
MTHLNSGEQHFTAAIKITDFEWIRYSGCSLHHQRTIGGIVRGLARIYVPWWCKRANRLMSDAAWQGAMKRKKILAWQ